MKKGFTMQRNLFRSCFSLFVAAFFALGGVAPAYSQNNLLLPYLSFTDIWAEDPHPQGSGWGVNFAQSDDFIFATFFVYDENGKPKWYTGELRHGYTFGSNGINFTCPSSADAPTFSATPYSGSFYLTTSGPTADMFSPINAKTTEVGKAAFVPDTPTTGRLCVQIGDTLLTKNIRRLTLTAPNLGVNGSYVSSGVLFKAITTNNVDFSATTYYSFDSPSFLSFTMAEDGVLTLAFKDIGSAVGNADRLFGGVCTLSGATSVEGPFYVAKNAVYQCTKNGAASRDTTADVYLRFSKTGGMEGYWVSKEDVAHGGYSDQASFSAVLQPPTQ